MAIAADGSWYPDLFDRQLEVFNSRARALLVCGPRKSGKTWAVLHKVVRHLWETPGARVAMFSKTLKNSKQGGTWDDLHKIVLPEWIDARIGLQYTTNNNEGHPGWKTDGTTRTPYFKIRNMHGGESELMLFSLDNDDDIEDKIKEQRFSLIYFSELTKFESRKVLTIALPQLRMPHLRMEQQQWIADTNPGEEGDLSWIYQVWYVERTLSYEDYCKRQGEKPKMEEQTWLSFQRRLQLIEIRPEENPHLPNEELEELKATYAYDEGLSARYVEGKWVYGDGDSSRHFRGAFNLKVHVVGDNSSPNKEEWEYLNVSPMSTEIITGWDLGDTNHAVAFIDKILVRGLKPYFSIVDEFVSIKENLSIADGTQEIMEMLEELEAAAGRKFDTDRAWSDRSSIEKYSATADTYPYLEVLAASGERFFLRGVPKAAGSVRIRVRLVKMLLSDKRLLVSRHCVNTIKMFQHLKKGDKEFVVQDENKHIFDAISYALLMECAEELENSSRLNPERRSIDVSIRL